MGKMKILAVCGFGVGTSLILRMNIEKVMKNLGVDADVENVDVTSVTGSHADLVCTSAELAGDVDGKVDAPVVVIHNFMSLDEITEKCKNQLGL